MVGDHTGQRYVWLHSSGGPFSFSITALLGGGFVAGRGPEKGSHITWAPFSKGFPAAACSLATGSPPLFPLLQAHSCTRKDFEKMYPAFPKFCSIRDKLDPTGMFLNTYLEKVFY